MQAERRTVSVLIQRKEKPLPTSDRNTTRRHQSSSGPLLLLPQPPGSLSDPPGSPSGPLLVLSQTSWFSLSALVLSQALLLVLPQAPSWLFLKCEQPQIPRRPSVQMGTCRPCALQRVGGHSRPRVCRCPGCWPAGQAGGAALRSDLELVSWWEEAREEPKTLVETLGPHGQAVKGGAQTLERGSSRRAASLGSLVTMASGDRRLWACVCTSSTWWGPAA